MDNDLTKYLIEIHEKVARIDSQTQTLAEEIREHRRESQAGNKVVWGEVDELREDLGQVRSELSEARGAIKGIMWLGGAVAAIVALFVKFLPLSW